jgi:hypothetical protein
MYGRWDTFEYLKGVEKFVECARKDMRVMLLVLSRVLALIARIF